MAAWDAGLKALRAYYRVLLLAAVAVAAMVASVALQGRIGTLDGQLYDLALAASARFAHPETEHSKVVVIALDRRSLDSPELKTTPRVLLGPYWAKLVNGLAAANVQAVGFDLIFSFSANGLLPNYDRPFIDMLARNRPRVVLGRSLETPIANPFYFALGANNDANGAGFAEVVGDDDNVVRRARPSLPLSDGTTPPTLAASVLRRAGLTEAPADVLLAPRAPLESLPTYALVDVLRCIETAPKQVAATFGGRMVMVGTTLPEEDRKLAPDRYMPKPAPPAATNGAASEGCQLQPLGASSQNATSVPGVFVHVAAIRAMLGIDVAHEAASAAKIVLAGATALLGGVIGLALAPWFALAALVGLAASGFLAETMLLRHGIWLPMALPAAAAAAALIIAYVTRFLIEERQRRRIQHAFGHYLAPAVVEQLLDGNSQLRLGGTTQEVSIMFADLSGFTALSGEVGPEQLMEMTNRYLQIIAEAVDSSGGGYVDKFIGDAVMAIWGAPATDCDHAVHAARAALTAADRVAEQRDADQAAGHRGFSVKIGVNSGSATVGNVGAPKRYNYTAVGETVNIAARLESLPGDYGCRIVVGPNTAALIDGRFLLNELDWIKVKGKREPLAVFELIAEVGMADAASRAYVETYAEALAAYRQRRFVEAEALWRTAAQSPVLASAGLTPPLVMAARAADMQSDPPPNDWDGVWVKAGK